MTSCLKAREVILIIHTVGVNYLRKVKPAKPAHPIDFPMLLLTLTVLAFGLIMVLSAGSVIGFNLTEDSFFFILQQVKWTLIGSVFALVVIKVPYSFWRKFAGIGVLICLVLLIAVKFSEAGHSANGSARWLYIGPLKIQPSEIAKLTFVLFYAHIIERYPIKRGKDWRIPLGILLPVTLVVLGLVFKQPDLGTTMVLGATCAAMLLQTEIPTIWFVAAVPSVGLPLLYVVHSLGGYQWDRILAWLDPWKYASGIGYQITNAEIAFGSGGIFGVGLGHSAQKYGFLPENYTDMIFAMVGEELGLVGALVLLILLIALYARIFSIIRECPDRFGRLLGFGLASSLAIQTTINLAVVTGVIPVTGITLPLISYGGSSLVITLIEIGLLLNISRFRKKKVVKNTVTITG